MFPIVQHACVVNIVIITGIFSLIELKYVFSTPAAPGRHPIPETARRAPSPTHTAAFAIPGVVAAKPGERRPFKVALPETASNHYVFCWLNGSALHSGQTERQLNPLSLRFRYCFCCTAVILLYTHYGIVGCRWIGFSDMRYNILR